MNWLLSSLKLNRNVFVSKRPRAFPIQLYTSLAFGIGVLRYPSVHSARLASAALCTVQLKRKRSSINLECLLSAGRRAAQRQL
jgi:hypothetical protein